MYVHNKFLRIMLNQEIFMAMVSNPDTYKFANAYVCVTLSLIITSAKDFEEIKINGRIKLGLN